VSFVPLMMFAICSAFDGLRGLLMSHIRERWMESKENHTSVVEGLAHTGRVIT